MNLCGFKYWLFALMLCFAESLFAQNDVPAAQRHRESPVRIVRVDSYSIRDTLGVKDTINVKEAIEYNIIDDKVVIDNKEENEITIHNPSSAESDSLSKGVILLQNSDTAKVIISGVQQAEEIVTTTWMPDPKKALWMAIAIPGGGQIYNRKYWKLPIIYGGFMGCLYAMNWNNTMYHDYAQAYMDIMDDDPNTHSFYNFLPPTYDVNSNLSRLQNLFKKKKDYYRRYRDLSIFCIIGVYALSIIDAYVDAELSSFDISRDLSMKIRPSVINDQSMAYGNKSSYGLKCSIAF